MGEDRGNRIEEIQSHAGRAYAFIDSAIWIVANEKPEAELFGVVIESLNVAKSAMLEAAAANGGCIDARKSEWDVACYWIRSALADISRAESTVWVSLVCAWLEWGAALLVNLQDAKAAIEKMIPEWKLRMAEDSKTGKGD
jgi:hypothetical protein